MAKRAAVFLDRDGTINVEAGYLRRLEDLVLMPGAAEAIRQLNARGIPAILVTNQSGAARGYFSEDHVRALNQRLVDLLAAEGAHLDALYYCPHLPEGVVPGYAKVCDCRKPAPGMVDLAAKEHDLDVAKSYVVGDKATDVELGQAVGARSVLLRSGYGARVLSGDYQWACNPDHVADDLAGAVDWILADMGAKTPA